MTEQLPFPAPASLEATLYPPNSRYHAMEVLKFDRPGKPTIAYIQRRFLPRLDGFELLREHPVVEGDRIDNLAFQYLGDPEQFWRVCDANLAMNPPELTSVPGARIHITLPEGVTAPSHA